MLCRLAVCPTSTSPLSVKATIEGVVRPPSEFSMTFASPPSITATHELVVPRSMPIALAIFFLLRRQVVRCTDRKIASADRVPNRPCTEVAGTCSSGEEAGTRQRWAPRPGGLLLLTLVFVLRLVLPLALIWPLVLDLRLPCF